MFQLLRLISQKDKSHIYLLNDINSVETVGQALHFLLSFILLLLDKSAAYRFLLRPLLCFIIQDSWLQRVIFKVSIFSCWYFYLIEEKEESSSSGLQLFIDDLINEDLHYS